MVRRPTIIDVAERAGVSKSTVSRVVAKGGEGVSERTRRRVQKVIEEIGYVHNVVASSLRTEKTKLIMLAIPDINNPFWPEYARGVQDAMEESEYQVVFANSEWNTQRERAYLQRAQNNRFDGVLICPIGISNDDLLASGIPAVIIGHRKGFPDFDCVGSDSYTGVKEALTYLTTLGHTRIGLVLGKRTGRPNSSRKASYIDYHQENGIPLDKNVIRTVPYNIEGGKRGLGQLIQLENTPTAIICDNDVLAIGGLLAAKEAGIQVPGDLSIVGIDDIFAASTTVPPLTTIRKPKYENGRQAAKLLLDRMNNGPKSQRQVLISCNLIVRGSTGPPGI